MRTSIDKLCEIYPDESTTSEGLHSFGVNVKYKYCGLIFVPFAQSEKHEFKPTTNIYQYT